MSKYDDWIFVHVEATRPLVELIINVNRDIDARLAKLEAEKVRLDALEMHVARLESEKQILSHSLKLLHQEAEAQKPTPSPTQPQREPGLYPVKMGPDSDWVYVRKWTGAMWTDEDGDQTLGNYFWIGPRIQPPEGAV